MRLPLALIVVSAATVVIVNPGVGAAHHGTPAFDNMVPTSVGSCENGSRCRTDNAQLTIYRGATLDGTAKSNVYTAANSWFNPTDLDVSYPTTAVTSGISETDLMVGISNFGIAPNKIGVYYCDDPLDSGWKCDQGYIHFRANSYVTPGTSCHEIGHGVGLEHGDEAEPAVALTDSRLYCLKDPVEYNVGLGPTNTHWIQHVYPN